MRSFSFQMNIQFVSSGLRQIDWHFNFFIQYFYLGFFFRQDMTHRQLSSSPQ